jgi:alkanesulfonate monooxygenase SsuD/methylene tetrahydromethanopterin reductase-like flavin-dependent oxidoreductase (luciferase family)
VSFLIQRTINYARWRDRATFRPRRATIVGLSGELVEDLPRFTERFAYFPGGLTLERLDEWGTSLIGSPETVAKKARQMIETARPDSLVGMFSFGGLSHAQVTRSIELFATRVMPRLAAEPLG